MRHNHNHNECWFTEITKKMVRENPTRFKPADIGHYLIHEDVDLFEPGDIVSQGDIQRQLEVFRTGRLSAALLV